MKILRRSLFSALIAPLLARRTKTTPTPTPPPLASGAEILRSFDAQHWAKHFVAHVAHNPSIATDEETMTTWFSNSLMRGYDERQHELNTLIKETGASVVYGWKVEAIRGAVARGYCCSENQNKVFDGDLCEAITQEIMAMCYHGYGFQGYGVD